MGEDKRFHSTAHEGAPTRPRDSSTVILLRDVREGPFQIFLMRRHQDQNFMGGAYVFPGGKLDTGDCDPSLEPRIRGLSPARARQLLQEPAVPEHTALGLFLAAVRETFEESGVLLACDGTGSLLRFGEGETAGRFASYRLQLYEKKISLRDLAEKENLLYTLDLLVPFAHWVTPEVESRRFDTRFFLALHPKGQAPFHANIEMTRSLWTTPAAALRDHEAGRILLMPPTLKTVEELSAFSCMDDLFSHARNRTIDTILPEAFRFPGGFGVKLPHDPEYTLSEYKLPSRPDESSRIVMEEGRWRTARATGGPSAGSGR
jgi:8-oxo-dGTP pyrophosphatase MutT (NUDIX family)